MQKPAPLVKPPDLKKLLCQMQSMHQETLLHFCIDIHLAKMGALSFVATQPIYEPD